jgi:hypothetical protein
MTTKQKRTSETKPRDGVDVLNDIRAVAQTAIKAVQDGNASMVAIALKALELEGRHYGIFDREAILNDDEILPREIVFQVLPPQGETRVTIGKKRDGVKDE